MSYFTKTYHPPGTSPGTLTNTITPDPTINLYLIDYSDGQFLEKQLTHVDDCKPYLSDDFTSWIHVRGEVDAAVLAEIGSLFGLHPLAMEDVLNRGQRPKIDDFDKQLFIALAVPQGDVNKLSFKQLSLFLGPNYLISFYSGDDSLFTPIRRRLKSQSDHLYTQQADYLLYSILDLIIDMSYPLLEEFGSRIEAIEDSLLEKPQSSTIHQIHNLRRELLQLRRTVWPLREVINRLLHDDNDLICRSTHIYLRDCYDHNIQIMDLLENYRDMTTSLLDVYLSAISNRLNETMRVLTLIATIFMPLTFIVGIYGMNFGGHNSPWAMPELRWDYGYPLVWGIMLLVTITMLIFFKRKGWLKRTDIL